MLAKAVATDAGANFINISMSSITSKVRFASVFILFSFISSLFILTSVLHIFLQWFGEGEKYVKAVFSLASKIAPSVIFVDEVSFIIECWIVLIHHLKYRSQCKLVWFLV